MAKLREAAIVAAMVGSVSMLGAGAASAHGDDDETPQTVIIKCTQIVGDRSASDAGSAGLVNINGPLLIGGRGEANSYQQLCGLDNEDARSAGGTGNGGEGGLLSGIEL